MSVILFVGFWLTLFIGSHIFLTRFNLGNPEALREVEQRREEATKILAQSKDMDKRSSELLAEWKTLNAKARTLLKETR